MKKIVSFMLAAVIGGFVFKGLDLITEEPQKEKVVYINEQQNLPTKFATAFNPMEDKAANFYDFAGRCLDGKK